MRIVYNKLIQYSKMNFTFFWDVKYGQLLNSDSYHVMVSIPIKDSDIMDSVTKFRTNEYSQISD